MVKRISTRDGIYEEIQNQTKQLNSLQHLVLDLKDSQSSKQKAENKIFFILLPDFPPSNLVFSFKILPRRHEKFEKGVM